MEKGKPMASAGTRKTTSPRFQSQETSRAEALIAACDSASLFFSSTVGSFTKEALCKLRGVSDESLLHLSLTVREHDPVKDARRLLQVQGGHGITATLLDARVQLTQGPLYLYFAAESARTNFSLLDQKPLWALNCVDSVEITKVSCTDCISAFLSKFRAPVEWSLHTSIEDLLSCMHVGVRDMNATKVLLMGNVNVNETDPEQNTAIYLLCLCVSSRTQEPRIV